MTQCKGGADDAGQLGSGGHNERKGVEDPVL
jgi:hypothetical protein